MTCSFGKSVWKELTKSLVGSNKWDKRTLNDYLLHWLTEKYIHHFKELVFLFIYSIWWYRNQMWFLDKVFTPALATHRIKLAMHDNKVSPKEKAVRFLLMLSIDQEMSGGFIGGTSQGHLVISGVETILYFDSYHYFTLKYIAGQGSNNHAEFYALWILLKNVEEKWLNHVQVYGDSKLMIDW